MRLSGIRWWMAFLVCCAALAQGRSLAGQPDGRRRHDPLPARFDALSQYDQIALEPYREKYDAMPLHEKARVYAQAFEFMNGRKPDFPPAVLERIRRSEEAASPRSAYETKKFMYKPPPEPRERGRQKPTSQEEKILSAIPMPWADGPEPPEAPEPLAAPEPEEGDDHRMESLRHGGWQRTLRRR